MTRHTMSSAHADNGHARLEAACAWLRAVGTIAHALTHLLTLFAAEPHVSRARKNSATKVAWPRCMWRPV
jgi:hypothetical protein